MPRNVPALIVAGALDDRAPVSDGHLIASYLARAEVLVVQGANHEDVGRFVTHSAGRAAIRTLLAEVARE